jgi:prepilin-type N-terminal cleavage/methylation domain-containing protein
MRTRLRGFTLVELMVVIAIIGLLASVLATSVMNQLRAAGKEMDKKVMHDLYNEMQMLAAFPDPRTQRMFAQGQMAERRGREFYEGLFKYGLLTHDMLPRLISTAGDDFEADRRGLDEPETFKLARNECSWTGPQGNEFFHLLRLQGKHRRVIMSANERNWFIHNDDVLVMWTDGNSSEYISMYEIDQWAYDISQEQWDSPAEHLFGKVRPFDGVFE